MKEICLLLASYAVSLGILLSFDKKSKPSIDWDDKKYDPIPELKNKRFLPASDYIDAPVRDI